jgi:hypothetical protein
VGETNKTIIAQNVNKFVKKPPLKNRWLTAYLPMSISTSKQTEIKRKNSAAAKNGLSRPIE